MEDILSNDPTRIAEAEAPAINAQRGLIEQQELKNAQFNTRSGGTTASTEAADAGGRANIINLVGGLKSGTAAEAGSLGSNQEQMGAGNIHDVAGMKTARRAQETQDVGGIEKGVAQIATGMMTGGMGGEGGLPEESTPGAINDAFSASMPQSGSLESQYGVDASFF
jgi:hypothetical protein